MSRSFATRRFATCCVVLAWIMAWLAVWGVGVRSVAAAPAPSWEQAQATQRRALRAEKRALEHALSETRANAATAKAALQADIERLSERLTRLQVENARREREVPGPERTRSDAAHAARLQDLLVRMQDFARTAATNDGEYSEADLPGLVAGIFAQIADQSRLRLEAQGEYFDADGKLAEAPILHIGQVAAVRWDREPTPLIATPEGLRAVAGVPGSRERHGDKTITQVVVYDPESPPDLASYGEPDWRSKMERGGPIMWVLLAVGVIALAIVIERSLGLLWAWRCWRVEQIRFEHAVRQRRTSALLDVEGWIAKPLVIAASARCPSCATEADSDAQERATQALMVMRERLQRRLSLVNIAAGIAPLLGLLGTVTGMIHTFSVVTDTGTSEPEQLAAGISQALLTTQFGLAIAIPAFLAHALLSRAARRILAAAEQTVLWYLHGAEPVAVAHDQRRDAHGS